MKQQKQFDLGIYSFARKVVSPEDQAVRNGDTVAVLLPMKQADPQGIYCFGVLRSTLQTVTLVKKNLTFRKVVTLHVDREASYFEEVHAQLNRAAQYLQEGQQLAT